MTQHGKAFASCHDKYTVGLFLPSMEGTKLAFLRAILCDEKKAFKTQEVKLIEIPNYPEISVRNLYEDAMHDESVAVYLPTKEMLSNKLPERNFFFGILSTLREDYVKEIISDAHKKRYSINSEDRKKQGIRISNTWLEELNKHPYISSKIQSLTL